MAVSNKPWGSFKDSDYTTQQYVRAALINENTGPEKDWTKDKAHLPVREPDGTLNRNGVHAAAAALAGARGGVNLSAAQKKAAAKKLITLYRADLKEDPPDSLKRLAA